MKDELDEAISRLIKRLSTPDPHGMRARVKRIRRRCGLQILKGRK